MGKLISADFRGFEDFQRRLVALAKADPWTRTAAGVLKQRAFRIYEVSQRLVPVDLGALKASGFVSLPDIQGDWIEITIGYGGPAAPYAFYVHEDLEAFHDDGQAKYLEIPFLAERDGMIHQLREAVKEHVRERLGELRAAA
jgi:hypothetical protein